MKTLKRSLVTLAWMISGAAAYLFFLNRLLIQARNRRFKSFMIRGGGLLTVGFSAALGWRLGYGRSTVIPALGLLVAAAGEVRRLALRARHRGSPPVREEGPVLSLAKPNTTTDLVVRFYETRVQGWRGPRVRVAHISDFHLNHHLPLEYFVESVRRVTAAEPDFIFFTGDFITRAKFAPLIQTVLPLARGRLGVYGVIGNHDRWADAADVRAAAEAAGIRMLDAAPVRIALQGGSSVVIAGYEHPWGVPREDAPAFFTGGELALVLTHTPDNIHSLENRGIDAVFAGHYHGGQIRIPGFGALVVPSKYGRQYDHGHFVFGRTHLFVTSGVGSAEPPVRIWCPPDALVVDFLPEED
jgi:predicted MPP superfamily phosphohydrolase